MKMASHKLALTAAALGAAITTATPAAACQGPQWESSLVLFSDSQKADVPDGMVQLRVRIGTQTLRDVHSRDLIRVWSLTDERDATKVIDKATGTLQIEKPLGTSCDSVSIPPKGIYYVTGTLVMGEDGKPVTINGGKLFRPLFKSVKAFPDFGVPTDG